MPEEQITTIANRRPFITVAAIAYNEAAQVDGFIINTSGADAVVVLDTGSTDNTPELLDERGANVSLESFEQWSTPEEYTELSKPFRFDVARNHLMGLIPPETDILIALDLDERIHPANWADKLRELWVPGTEQARYSFIFDRNTTLEQERIFHPKVFTWTHLIHEIPTYIGPNAYPTKLIIPKSEFWITHEPLPKETRQNYLGMLEQAVKENPNDDRDAYYYARELMYSGKYIEAIAAFRRYLNMSTATWREERSRAYSFLGDCTEHIGGTEDSIICYYLDAAQEYPSCSTWGKVLEYAVKINSLYHSKLAADNVLKCQQSESAILDRNTLLRLTIAYDTNGEKLQALALATQAYQNAASNTETRNFAALVYEILKELYNA